MSSIGSRRARASSDGPSWSALAVLAAGQLLIVLDATIVSVVLSDIQADLRLPAADLQWVFTAYVLAFGGFLLLGGRLADRYGRRRLFMIGTAAFGVGSVLCGLAESGTLLLAGRALQGLAAAALAPAALSLVMSLFVDGSHRDRALGVWGAVSAGGTGLGLILGGVITQASSWEWIFWVNVPVTAAMLAAAALLLPESRSGDGQRFDVAGAVLGTAGLIALVYGLVEAAATAWDAGPALSALVAAAALLAAFVWSQRRRAYALVPTRLLRNRSVLAADLIGLILGFSIYGLFYFLSLFMGGTLDYDPVMTGLAFMPMTVAIAIASNGASRLIGRVGARRLLITSVLLVAAAVGGLIGIEPDSTYIGTLLVPLVAAGFGLGIAFVALTAAAVGAAPAEDSGVAAALFNAGQQIGGGLGLAVLTAVSTAWTDSLSASEPGAPNAADVVAGWSSAFGVAAALTLVAVMIAATLVRVGPREVAQAG